MSITTFSFAYMLFVLILFYLCRRELRIYILGLSSIFYAFLVSNITGIGIVVITIFSYLCGLLIYYLKDKKIGYILFIFSIICLSGSLLYFKYIDNTLLAIGYSFFCFQAISYIADIKNNKVTPVLNPVRLAVFFAWFPKLVSGPIERIERFNLQLGEIQNASLSDVKRLKKSFSYIFVGCFYKLVLADRISPFADGIFDMPHIYQTRILIIGILIYTIQIYCDFAGYSMVAIGVSNLFGIDLIENFRSPYFSTSVSEFWKRWHISLTDWLRDYIYIPLGGNRKGKIRLYINLLIVFVISGIWHGNGIGFLIWGLLHAVLSIVDRIIDVKNRVLGWLLTFGSVSFAWMFFKAATWERISMYIQAMLANNRAFPIEAQLTQLGVDRLEVKIAIIAFVVILIIDLGIKKYKSLEECINSIPLSVWCLFMWIIIMGVVIFGIYGPSFEGGRMIYMQF